MKVKYEDILRESDLLVRIREQARRARENVWVENPGRPLRGGYDWTPEEYATRCLKVPTAAMLRRRARKNLALHQGLSPKAWRKFLRRLVRREVGVEP